MTSKSNDISRSAHDSSSSSSSSPSPSSLLPSVDEARRRLLSGTVASGAAAAISTGLLGACGSGAGTDGAPAAAASAAPGNVSASVAAINGKCFPPVDGKIASFSIAVLPDTQFYSRYATDEYKNQFARLYGSEPFIAQTRWVAENAGKYNIPFLIHLGDIVDRAMTKGDAEWQIADAAMKVLEDARVPYSVLAGNHDVLASIDYVDAASQSSGTEAQRNPLVEPYLRYFSAERAKKNSTFRQRDPSGFHEYHIVEAEGMRFMVLSLSWRIAEAGIAWANEVLRLHPGLPCILVNHQLLNIDSDGIAPLETEYGKMLWERLIRGNDQIFLALNGHHHGAARLTRTNDFGNPVELMVVDYQMAFQGGNGQMRLYEFDLSNNRINVLSFSPWVPLKPAATLQEFDRALLDDASNTFSIPFDFKARFARFAPEFQAAPPKFEASLAELARAEFAAFRQIEAAPKRRPSDQDDYVRVPATVAHWRFGGGAEGQPVMPGAVVQDLTGANPVHRARLDADGVVGAEVGDMVWSADCHMLSAAMGSVQFLNADKKPPRLSCFVTDENAPANRVTLDEGYTVEAFVKIAKEWAASKNAWMNILTRDGMRGMLASIAGGMEAEDPEAPPLLFAVSSLREIQWDAVPTTPLAVTQSAWSGEIMAGNWIHVAIVNDPKSFDTTMYIEGAPVLRNVTNKRGIGTLNKPWVVGGGAWPVKDASGAWQFKRADGFLGAIAEVRIVAAALSPKEWLTARRG